MLSLSFGIHEVDFWWHLAIGRMMVEEHTFFRHEMLSHTVFGAPWINFEWLAQVFFYAVWKLTGPTGVFWSRVGASLLVIGLLAFSIRKSGSRGPILFALTAWGFLVIHFRLLEKPELVTLLLLPILVIAISTSRSLRPTEIARSLPFLFAAMIVWVNCHAGFIYGMALVACCCLGARWADESPVMISYLDRLMVLFFMAVLINPYGPFLITMFVEVLTSGATKVITDYSVTPFDIYRSPFWALLFVSFGLAIMALREPRLRKVRLWIPALLMFGFLGTRQMRSMVLLPFIALPFIGEVAAERIKATWRPLRWAAPVLGFLLLIQIAAFTAYIRRTMPPPPVSPSLPEAACRFVEDNDLDGVLFNEVDLGGYLTWRLTPQRKIFMDGRYPFQHLQIELHEIWKGFSAGISDRYSEFFNRHGVDYALVSYADQNQLQGPPGAFPFPLSIRNLMFHRDHWALVYWDDTSLIFLKRVPKFQRFIERHEFRVIRPYNVEQMGYLLHHGFASPRSVEKELSRHEESVGPTKRAQRIRALLKPFSLGGSQKPLRPRREDGPSS